MLDQVLEFFDLFPDFDLDLMRPNQSLPELTARVFTSLEPVLDKTKPDVVFVQGDTTTVVCGALSAYYKKVRVAHLEAGLRTGNKYSPFPEEINRVLTSRLSDYHFAPTPRAAENLRREGITENVWVVGNTVIDALFLGLSIIREKGEASCARAFPSIDFGKRIILVTGHRRESFGGPFRNICRALAALAEEYPDVEIVYPVHLNPQVRTVVFDALEGRRNIHLLDPLDYPHLIYLMNKSYLVLTDSGGIQEEAPSLGKPVLVLRDVTERQEGVEAGTARLVGTDTEKIIREASLLLDDTRERERMAAAANPYGDGTSSRKIVDTFLLELKSAVT
jgi:UDP-N-acetylglucosamine 2-epimerase (non-hydrolysing)